MRFLRSIVKGRMSSSYSSGSLVGSYAIEQQQRIEQQFRMNREHNKQYVDLEVRRAFSGYHFDARHMYSLNQFVMDKTNYLQNMDKMPKSYELVAMARTIMSNDQSVNSSSD